MFRSILFSVAALVFLSYGVSNYLAGKVAEPQAPAADADSAPQAASLRPSPGYGELTIAPDRSGNYFTTAEIDGHVTRMMVDTGATYVALTYEDAAAIGLRPGPVDYRYRTQTANGTAAAAKVHLATLRISTVEVDDVDAFVMPQGALGMSLLGMSALSRLGKVEISGGQLVLRQ